MNASSQALVRLISGVRLRVRLRRGILAGTLILTALPAVSIGALCLRLLGWAEPWSWTRASLVLVALSSIIAGILAGLGAVSAQLVAKEVDRRLLLDGALMTALEVVHSPDPIHWALVRRTATALRGVSLESAVPLRMPALFLLLSVMGILTFGLNAATLSLRSRPAVGDQHVESEALKLSQDLQTVASVLLRAQGREREEFVTAARRLLELESSLRAGTLGTDEARSAVSALAASMESDSDWWRALKAVAEGKALSGFSRADTGTSTAGARKEARSALVDVRVDDTSRSEFATGASGRAPGPGIGNLQAGPIVPASGGARGVGGTTSWILPPPSRTTSSGARDGAVGPDRQPSTWPVSETEPTLFVSPVRPLTPSEHVLMKAYFSALRRQEASR